MIVAVDFDNTLAMGSAQHISILAPNRPLIARLRELRRTVNPTIKIVTARGGKDGLTTPEKEAKYGGVITAWLKKYDVPFDEISFKKEYANLYIDDQTITPHSGFEGVTSTFTGNRVILTETTAIKYAKSALFEFEWYKQARLLGFNVPEVLFCNDECIITQRIHGYRKAISDDFIAVLEALKRADAGSKNDFQTYLDNLKGVESAPGITPAVLAVLAGLEGKAHPATFFHGDLSTTNVFGGDPPTLIDPNCKHIFGSYLTDAGKAVFSLIAYEAKFQEAQKIVDEFGPDVWHFAVAEGLRVCKYQPKYISIVNNIADFTV